MTAPTADDLRTAIAREEARLASLEDQRQQAQHRLEALKAQLIASEVLLVRSTACCRCSPIQPGQRPPPRRWPCFASSFAVAKICTRSSGPTPRPAGRATRRPAQTNGYGAFAKNLGCKCGECPNQAFLPVTEQVLLDHLQGRHVVGVYPLLTRRDLLARRGRLRQGLLDRRRAGFRGDLPGCRHPGRGRALSIGRGCACVVLLRGAGHRERRAEDGLLSASPRRWPVATSSAWRPTIASSRTRTRCRGVGLAI